jgi:Zn finger protein HypA/HybF involved in hydrogenase expression
LREQGFKNLVKALGREDVPEEPLEVICAKCGAIIQGEIKEMSCGHKFHKECFSPIIITYIKGPFMDEENKDGENKDEETDTSLFKIREREKGEIRCQTCNEEESIVYTYEEMTLMNIENNEKSNVEVSSADDMGEYYRDIIHNCNED